MSTEYNILTGLSPGIAIRQRRPRYAIPEGQNEQPTPARYEGVGVMPSGEPTGTNTFGGPAVEQLRILAGVEAGGQQREWPEYVFPGTLMITQLRNRKKIVEKEVVNGGAWVTEGIHTGRAEFSLEGVITGRGNLRPVDILNALEFICGLEAAFEVEHPVLDALGIDWMYIQDYDFGMRPGWTNTVEVRLRCKQYTPHVLELKDINGTPDANASEAKPLNTTPVNA